VSTLREAPQFRVAPAPTEEEAAAIAAAMTLLLEEEAAAASARQEDDSKLSPWMAEARGEVTQRGAIELRFMLPAGSAWRFSGRVPQRIT